MTANNSSKSRGAASWLRRRRVELIALAVAALLIVIDQITKIAIASNFSLGESRPIIDGVLNLTYIHNDGAVFGSLSGMPYIFNTVTVIIVLVAITLLLLGKLKGKWLIWTTALILSGGVGNMIDRFRLGYVIDFIDVKCFGRLWVWIFNIADCFVVIGCMMLIIYFIMDTVADYKKQKAAKAEKSANSESASETATEAEQSAESEDKNDAEA